MKLGILILIFYNVSYKIYGIQLIITKETNNPKMQKNKTTKIDTNQLLELLDLELRSKQVIIMKFSPEN